MPKYQVSKEINQAMRKTLDDFGKEFTVRKTVDDFGKDFFSMENINNSFKNVDFDGWKEAVASKTGVSEEKRETVKRVRENFERIMKENLSEEAFDKIKQELRKDLTILKKSDTKISNTLFKIGKFADVFNMSGDLFGSALMANSAGMPKVNFTQKLAEVTERFISDLKPMPAALGVDTMQSTKLKPLSQEPAPTRSFKTDQEYIDFMTNYLGGEGKSEYSIEKIPTDGGFVIQSKKDGKDVPHLDVNVSADKTVSATFENVTLEEESHLIKKLVATYMAEHNPKSVSEVQITFENPEMENKIKKEITKQICAKFKDENSKDRSKPVTPETTNEDRFKPGF